MAVFQAALSFALFTGVEPDVGRMLRHFATLTETTAAVVATGRSAAERCGPASPPSASAARSRRSSPRPPRAGFDGVELFEADLIASPLSPDDVRLRAAELGLSDRPLPAVPRLRGGRPRRGSSATCGRAEAKFDVMERARRDDDARLLQRLARRDRRRRPRRRAAPRARRAGRRRAGCGSPTRRSPGAATSTSTTTRGASSRPPATPRSAPASTASTSCRAARPLDAIAAIPAEKLFFVQLADAPHLVMDVLQWSRHYRCFPGQGGFDLAGFVDARPRRRLRRAAVARGLQRRLPPGRPGPHGGRRDALAADPPGGARPAACARRLPPATDLGGYAFVELAIEPASVGETQRVLHALGCAPPRSTGPSR